MTQPPVTAPSVRLALPREAAGILAARRAVYDELPPALAAPMLPMLADPRMRDALAELIARPPLASYRVLVAVDGREVVGYAYVSPTEGEEEQAGVGEIQEIGVVPERRRQGHGSRLLAAAVDTLRADGFQLANTWVRTDDDALRQFLVGAGFAPDGGHRESEALDGSVTLKMVRLHTRLVDEA